MDADKKFTRGIRLIILTALGVLGVTLGASYIYNHPGSFQDKDYRTPCEEKDFVKAYEIVDNLKEIASKEESHYNEEKERWGSNDGGAAYRAARDLSEKAERYVILQEGLYMLEQGDDIGLMKIAVIAKEHNANWLYDELEEVARNSGNDELADRINKMKK